MGTSCARFIQPPKRCGPQVGNCWSRGKWTGYSNFDNQDGVRRTLGKMPRLGIVRVKAGLLPQDRACVTPEFCSGSASTQMSLAPESGERVLVRFQRAKSSQQERVGTAVGVMAFTAKTEQCLRSTPLPPPPI